MSNGPSKEHKAQKTRYVTSAVIFLAVAALYLSGAMRFVDNKLLEARFAVFGRDATPDLVIVAIDAESLEEVGTWPWPREYHARVLETLLDAGAERVAFDVDFSSASTVDGDARFAGALRRAGPRAILPVFKQYRQGHAGEDAGETGIIVTEPLAPFREKAALASVSLRPDPDGVVRRVDIEQPWKEGRSPSWRQSSRALRTTPAAPTTSISASRPRPSNRSPMPTCWRSVSTPAAWPARG